MWSYLEGHHQSMKWVARALEQGTAIMVPDGAYNKALDPTICGSGWMIACMQQCKLVGGWFYEKSTKAGSYQGELLGAVATHLLATFTAEYYSLPGCKGEYICDNKGALGQAAKILQRVRTGAKHLDLLRALRSIKAKCPMEFCYSHAWVY